MKIIETRVLRGTNVYHARPVIAVTLELEEKTEVGSHEIPEFTKRLIDLLPGLWEHRCSPGYPGGFIERLQRGTYFAHIVEHIALELSVLAGIEVGYGKSLYAGAEGRYRVVVRYKNEEGMKNLLKGAVDIANALYEGKPYDLQALIDETKEIIADTQLGPSAQCLVDAAEKRGIPWRRIGEGSLIELGYGKNRKRVQTAVTDRTSLIATDLVQDKDLTKTVLREAFIPVPRGTVVRSFEGALEAFEDLGAPLAVKPVNGHHGNGVSLNICDKERLKDAFELAREEDSSVLIERMYIGRDYRILVLDGVVVAAAERIPAHVVGDGEKTIEQLVEITNQDPRRGDGHMNVLTKLEIDTEVEKLLALKKLTPQSIPAKGERVFLRETANLSTGGTAKDVTDLMHPNVRLMCERAAKKVGLDLCGLDLIHEDISKPIGRETAVIEVNAGPGLRMHLAPSEGQPRDVGGMIIDSLYPTPRAARIPMIAITGTNGKTTTARLTAHILNKSGFGTVGLTTTDGIYIGPHQVEVGDTTGPVSAQAVLTDPSVDAAVLEVARGGLLRRGLGYDWSDVGVITNIRPDHFGQDGIETIEDLVKIKSIVAERVRAGGTIVLNADDPEASHVMDRSGMRDEQRNVIYYSLNPRNPLILAHLERGGRAFFVDEGKVTEAVGTERFTLALVEHMDFTLRGTAWFQVSNALAAAAAASALGAQREKIAAALRTFDNAKDNNGRMNIYRVRDSYVIMDYGHNPDAIEAMSEFLKATRKRTIAVLGLPGDRSNELLQQSAAVAASGYDKLILRDDEDRRGRKVGEVPGLICEIVRSMNPNADCETVLDETEATLRALDQLKKGDVAILFCDRFDKAMEALLSRGATPLKNAADFFPATATPARMSESAGLHS